jgi:hypothetical protein
VLGSFLQSAGDPVGISAYAVQRSVATVCEHARLSGVFAVREALQCGVFTGRPCSGSAAERSNGSSDGKRSNASSAGIWDGKLACHTSPE